MIHEHVSNAKGRVKNRVKRHTGDNSTIGSTYNIVSRGVKGAHDMTRGIVDESMWSPVGTRSSNFKEMVTEPLSIRKTVTMGISEESNALVVLGGWQPSQAYTPKIVTVEAFIDPISPLKLDGINISMGINDFQAIAPLNNEPLEMVPYIPPVPIDTTYADSIKSTANILNYKTICAGPPAKNVAILSHWESVHGTARYEPCTTVNIPPMSVIPKEGGKPPGWGHERLRYYGAF